MMSQEVVLNQDQVAIIWSTNTMLVNVSPQPVIVKPNFIKIQLFIWRSRPKKRFTIAYTDKLQNGATPTFIAAEKDERMLFVNSIKPATGTIAALYYMHYRDELNISDERARWFAEARAIMWESARLGRSYQNFVSALGPLYPFIQITSESPEQEEQDYILFLKVFRFMRGPVE
jgi:hypothetical protein